MTTQTYCHDANVVIIFKLQQYLRYFFENNSNLFLLRIFLALYCACGQVIALGEYKDRI